MTRRQAEVSNLDRVYSVDAALIAQYGALSEPVARAMVWFGFMMAGTLTSELMLFAGDRTAVRAATVQHAMAGLASTLASLNPPA